MSAAMRVGIIGLGHAGSKIHIPALVGNPLAAIVGLCDPDPARRRTAAARVSAPTFERADAMLAETRPDVVIVATPPDSHAACCIQALEAGAHVVCEKPFVSSVEEADRVAAAAARAGRQVGVNHEFRYMPIFGRLVSEASQAGSLQFVQVWQLMNMPPWSESGWRGAMPQRALFEAGVHLVDLILLLYREKPTAVYAATYGGHDPTPGEAVVLATFEFSGGRLAQLVQNRLCQGEPQYFEVRVDTDQASLRASFGGRARLSVGLFRSSSPHLRVELGASGLAWRETGARRTVLARNPKAPNVAATRALLLETLRAFAENRAPASGVAAAREVIEVVAACYLSSRIGQRVAIDATIDDRLRTFRMGGAQKGR